MKLDVSDVKDHPYPHQFYHCAYCNHQVVRCKGCYKTTVNWWSANFTEIWDDLDQCVNCGAIFCPGCNQHKVGCRSATDHPDEHEAGEHFLYCDKCPLTSPYSTPTQMTLVT